MGSRRSFVFVHLRKTGGTFVIAVLRSLFRGGGWRGRLRRSLLGKRYLYVPHHGTCAAIPGEAAHLPVVSVVRNPFDRYVSMYHYRGWQRNPDRWLADPRALRRRFPSWPEVPFPDFVEAASTTFKDLDDSSVPEGRRLGAQSEELVRYFWREPERVFPSIDDAYIAGCRWERDMRPVRWIRMEHLNRDLHDLLVEFGCGRREAAFVLGAGHLSPRQRSPRRPGPEWRDHYPPDLLRRVRRRERLLLAMFPGYDPGE